MPPKGTKGKRASTRLRGQQPPREALAEAGLGQQSAPAPVDAEQQPVRVMPGAYLDEQEPQDDQAYLQRPVPLQHPADVGVQPRAQVLSTRPLAIPTILTRIGLFAVSAALVAVLACMLVYPSVFSAHTRDLSPSASTYLLYRSTGHASPYMPSHTTSHGPLQHDPSSSSEWLRMHDQPALRARHTQICALTRRCINFGFGRTFYEALGVPRTASRGEVKDGFLARMEGAGCSYPSGYFDEGSDDIHESWLRSESDDDGRDVVIEALCMTRSLLSRVFEVLYDEVRRRGYDEFLEVVDGYDIAGDSGVPDAMRWDARLTWLCGEDEDESGGE